MEKGNEIKKNDHESPIPMVILLIMIGLGSIVLAYFILLG
jgi:hypothetical protein